MKSKILIHSIVFSPDGVSTAYLYNDIALAFKKHNYEVVVLTTTPHYNIVESEIKKQPLQKKWLGLFFESNFNGIKVIHIPQKKFKSTALRLLGFIFWHIMSIVLGLRERGVGFILSPSPPLTIGAINLFIGKIKKAKVVYNVQEIYPDFLIEQGGLKNNLIISSLKKLEQLVYNKSDAVTTIDSVFYSTIKPRFIDKEKLHIIPNFVDTDLYRPIAKNDLSIDETIFLQNDHLKLMYAGNIGHAQDWMPLLEAALRLKNDPVDFYIIGEGVMKDFLVEKKEELGLDQLFILPYQNRNLMPELLSFSDIQFIFMSKEMEGHGFPSKVYTIMACSKPMIICSGENTPIVNFLKDLNCSKIITNRSVEEKVDEIVDFIRSSTNEHLQMLGVKGLDVVTKKYSKKAVTQKYVDLINEL